MITFRRVTEDDFPLLARWLSHPHVARWWNHEVNAEAVARDFGASARGEEPSEDVLALDDGTPVGLLQRARWHDYPEYVDELAPFWAVPAEAVTIDYLIGEAHLVGHGLGTRVLIEFTADTWRRYPSATCIVVPVATGNVASWRALEKAGYRRVAEAHLTPDNPIDPTDHVVMAIDRPAR
ncbi:GNAT family N-acetyltransferase [Rhodococcus sp. NBC_00294]|uniref:GNAT family N-acetyltransferase n=1 Tax=Rhodococcus sp. NBC_00294 TaxID=2976004 RepID=UPI002E284562|nr:GNAT family N-acetyltransferase [Rhodococcus sp. NBC_00294]